MASLGRASAILGAGTLVSRVTGLVRTIVLVAAIGSVGSSAADAFAVANQLPNNIYAIISTGILTGVIVPQIVAAASHSDGGSRFVSKLMTLGAVVLVAATALALAAAPWLVSLYGPSFTGPQLALAVAFAYWCLPQLLFYGIYALVGEVLNARRVFGPYTWAPIVNNFVSIAGFLVFIAVFGSDRANALVWSPAMTAVMGATATAGIALQSVVLLFFWRRAGLRVRPDFGWRGMGLRHIGTLAGWTFLMVVVGQLAALVQTRVVSEASGAAASVMTMQISWLIFMLPYSVIAFSIGTPYFTQLSEHVAAGRLAEVRTDLDVSIRTLGVFMVGATAVVAATAVPVARIFANDAAAAVATAWVLGAYLVGLVPLAVLFVIQRAFYAFHDTRSPFLFTLVQAALAAATALLAGALLPVTFLAAGIALGQSASSLIQLALAVWLLRRHTGPLQLGGTALSIGRFAGAAVPAALAGWVAFVLLGGADGWMLASLVTAMLGAAAIGTVVVAVYAGGLAVLRAPELASVGAALRRLRR